MALIPFKIDIESVAGADGLQLNISGRVDRSTAKEFEAALLEAEASDADAILVDLTAVTFMEYNGLAVLYEAHKRWREKGERLRVVACSGQVRNLFALSGVYDRLMGGRASSTQ